jgi:hypothetical protein
VLGFQEINKADGGHFQSSGPGEDLLPHAGFRVPCGFAVDLFLIHR